MANIIPIQGTDKLRDSRATINNNFNVLNADVVTLSAAGVSGYSGFSGTGISGYSGKTGNSGYSGESGYNGDSGYSGNSGNSGYSGISFYFQDVYDNSATYNLNDVVTFRGASYICISVTPITSYSPLYTSYWSVLTPSGYSGDTGLSGYSGISGYSGPGANQTLNTTSNVVFQSLSAYSFSAVNITNDNILTKFLGSWNVTVGTNNYSFSVNANSTYQMWVWCNIPNGIIVWNAIVTVTNSNVPVVGQQFAWVYNGGGSPIDFTSIPNQIIGTANTIVRSSTSVTNSNIFTFGVSNTSGSSQTVNYGWVKIS